MRVSWKDGCLIMAVDNVKDCCVNCCFECFDDVKELSACLFLLLEGCSLFLV